MGRIEVAGVGLVPFGEYSSRTCHDLFGEAGSEALNDAGVGAGDVDAVYYGNFLGELSDAQGHQGPLVADILGIDAPAIRLESACASSGVAVREATGAIRRGQYDVVLVGGAERLSNMGTTRTTEGLAMAADADYEVNAGVTFPGAYAMMARAYFESFGGQWEDLAHVAVKNHENALVNPYAQFRRELSIDEARTAPIVADPLRLYDACPISDGACALVLMSESFAENCDRDETVSITGSGQGSDTLDLQSRDHLARTPATKHAVTEAYEDAGRDSDDIDIAEVHDCFTIAEVLALEGLGFYSHGEAIAAARLGETTRTGRLPINLSGGLKAKGHPVGATGAAQVGEIVRLLRGDHPRASDVPDATVGLAHNAGGTVASATVHVLEVE